MEAQELIQKGSTFKATFEIDDVNSGLAFVTKTSPEYILYNKIIFQLRVIIARLSNSYSSEHYKLIFIRFAKDAKDDSNYVFKLSSSKLNITDRSYKSDDSNWRLIYELKTCYAFAFDVKVSVETIDTSAFSSLYDDEVLPDFKLTAEDGSVGFHKVVLAACSPALRRKFENEWRDESEGQINSPGVNATLLQNFKDYVYLGTLPDSSLKPLLLLATHCMMPALENKTIDKLISTLTAQNAIELSEFAVREKLTKLHIAVLECFQNGVVKVEDMREVCFKSKQCGDEVSESPSVRNSQSRITTTTSRSARRFEWNHPFDAYCQKHRLPDTHDTLM